MNDETPDAMLVNEDAPAGNLSKSEEDELESYP